jgi:hypothetical protein
MRRELIRHLGGTVTPVQRAMIERCAMLQLRCAALDRKILDGTFSEYDSKVYLAFSNSLVRTLKALGIQPAAATQKPMDAIEFGRLLAEQEHAAALAEEDAA